MTRFTSRVLPALALISVITVMSSSALAATTASKPTATPLKLSPATDSAAIDISKFATKADVTKLTNAILQVYAKLAEIEKRQTMAPPTADSGQSGLLTLQLSQQIQQLQAQVQTLQASQTQLQSSLNAALERMHRLDGATP